MNKNNAYIPNLSFRQTVDYIEGLRNQIFSWFEKNGYSIVSIDLPVSTNIESQINNDTPNIRSIDFDSTKDYSIYELIDSYDNLIRYMYYYYEPENNIALFFKYTLIDRDQIINGMLKDSLIYNFETPFKEVDRVSDSSNNNILKDKLESIWESIYEYAFNNKNTQIDVQKKFGWNSSHLIGLTNPLSSFNSGLEKHVKSKKLCGVFYKEKNFKEKFNHNFLQSYDANNTVSLYAWFDQLGVVDELITLTIRPNWEIFKKQNNIVNDETKKSFSSEFYKITKAGLKGVSLSIKFHIDKLVIYLLSKNMEEEIPSHLNNFSLGEIFKFNDIKNKK